MRVHDEPDDEEHDAAVENVQELSDEMSGNDLSDATIGPT